MAVAPCAVPPRPGPQGGSTFDKLGLLPGPVHATPNPQENSCRQPKTMLIKYAAKSPRTLQSLGLLDRGLLPRQLPRILAQNSPSPRAHAQKSSLSNLQPRPRPAPTPSWQCRETPLHQAVQVLSLVFIPTHPKSTGQSPPKNQTPCLSNLLPVARAKAYAQFRATKDQNFKGKRPTRPQKAAKPSPKPPPSLSTPQSAPPDQRPCLGGREPVIPRWMPGL